MNIHKKRFRQIENLLLFGKSDKNYEIYNSKYNGIKGNSLLKRPLNYLYRLIKIIFMVIQDNEEKLRFVIRYRLKA